MKKPIAIVGVVWCVVLLGSPWVAYAADWEAEAQAIRERAGFQGGLIVHVGCGDGRLTAALRRGEVPTIVHGLASCREQVSQVRMWLRSNSLDREVMVGRWRNGRLPYAENFVNLIVVEEADQLAAGELQRVLTPGGSALVRQDDEWEQITKEWPKEIGEWTHWLQGPHGNAVAADHVVGPPKRWQWMAEPIWSRSHHTVPSITAQVSAGGRLFYILDTAPAGMDGSVSDTWKLVARDAFNGLLLWERPLEDWGWEAWSGDWRSMNRFTLPTHIPHRLVAAGDKVYVTLGFNAPVSELDAATGQVVRVLEGTDYTDEILYLDGKLILSINSEPQRPGPPDEPPVRKRVAMIDGATGNLLWITQGEGYVGLQSKTGAMNRISHLSLVAGDGQVFFIDGDQLISLCCEDGRELWRVPRPEVPENRMRYQIRITDMCTLVYDQGRLFLAQPNPDRTIDWREIRAELHAFDSATGQRLWSRPCATWGWGHPPDVFVIRGRVWVGDYQEEDRIHSGVRSAARLLASGQWGEDFRSAFFVALNPATGEVEDEVSVFQAFNDGHHARCYRNKATERFLMSSYRGFEFIDWETGDTSMNPWVRGTCRLGGFPCNGLLYANPHPCACYIESKLNGLLALSPAEPQVEMAPPHQRVFAGPAYNEMEIVGSDRTVPASPEEWTIFRGDLQRSGVSPHRVQVEERLWEVRLGNGPLPGCTAGGGLLFTSVPETREVIALHPETGRVAWRVMVEGQVDTPPTFYQGRLFFGCSHGWVYSLRSSDGVEAWRFQAAPDDRLITARGRLESAWPVHGSLLVRDDRVYAVAGRSSFLDGGIFASVIDATRGQLLEERRMVSTPVEERKTTGHETPTQFLPGGDSGVLPDLLVCDEDEEGVFMRWHPLFPLQAGQLLTDPRPLSELGLLFSLGGFRDDSWFTRIAWFVGNRAYGDHIVFDPERVYGVRLRAPRPERNRDSVFTPGEDGHLLFAANRSQRTADEGWSRRVPVRVTSMVLAGDTLFAAGTPDTIDPKDPWAFYEGRRNGVLLAVEADTGEILQEIDLDAAPAWDALSAVAGRLYIASRDGRILCYGKP